MKHMDLTLEAHQSGSKQAARQMSVDEGLKPSILIQSKN